MKKLTVPMLVCVAIFVAGCAGYTSDSDDEGFIEFDFDTVYELVSEKKFDLTLSGAVSATLTGSGEACLAVGFNGEAVDDEEDYFGFAAMNSDNTFNLKVFFEIPDGSTATGDVLKAHDEYNAVLRYGDVIYQEPVSDLDITIIKNTSSRYTIIINENIELGSPSAVTISANDYVVVQMY
ncbi:MAG: hypothetical protein CVV44_15610 [Spirochaetae bacterium HGW-Spirochaetae-1]|jgi:hypothetical protein|nr:MAG: hypothetical protein CVV44_15610 [Spirochaetae bacterium HGW-Spirochaetae-1]